MIVSPAAYPFHHQYICTHQTRLLWLLVYPPVIELRRKARESGISIENDLNSTGGNQSRANVLASRTAAGRSMADRRIDEELLTQKYAKTYDKLETISSKLANDDTSSDDVSLMTEYIHLAFPLVEGFRQTSALFPCVLVGLLTYFR